jgi:hypothetical protein
MGNGCSDSRAEAQPSLVIECRNRQAFGSLVVSLHASSILRRPVLDIRSPNPTWCCTVPLERVTLFDSPSWRLDWILPVGPWLFVNLMYGLSYNCLIALDLQTKPLKPKLVRRDSLDIQFLDATSERMRLVVHHSHVYTLVPLEWKSVSTTWPNGPSFPFLVSCGNHIGFLFGATGSGMWVWHDPETRSDHSPIPRHFFRAMMLLSPSLLNGHLLVWHRDAPRLELMKPVLRESVTSSVSNALGVADLANLVTSFFVHDPKAIVMLWSKWAIECNVDPDEVRVAVGHQRMWIHNLLDNRLVSLDSETGEIVTDEIHPDDTVLCSVYSSPPLPDVPLFHDASPHFRFPVWTWV